MNSIILTYPGFQTLPRGVKQMLVASETSFFSEAKAPLANVVTSKPVYHQAPRIRSVGLDCGWAENPATVWSN